MKSAFGKLTVWRRSWAIAYAEQKGNQKMLYKKTVTRPLPSDAVISTRRTGEQIATWTANGKKRTAPVHCSSDGLLRITVSTGVWYARFRGADDLMVDRSTGCRDRSAAETVLRNWMAQEEKIRAGIVTPSELKQAEHGKRGLAEHVDGFMGSLERKGCGASHMRDVRANLQRVIEHAGWQNLRDIDRAGLERYLDRMRGDGLSARSVNVVRTAWVSFGNWCIQEGLLPVNPFIGVATMNEAADPRRPRRALSTEELARLFDAAAARPLHDAMHKNRGKDAAKLSKRTREALMRTGRERRMLYAFMAGTGLRLGEARALRVCDVDIESDPARLTVRAACSKNRKMAVLPIRSDLAAELRRWVAELQGGPVVSMHKEDMALFPGVPETMTRVFDRDLAFAGIAKRDARGETVDVHSLRHTFCSRLAAAGVPLAMAQRLMRHSDPALTSNRYTHFEVCDMNGAVESMANVPTVEREVKTAHGGAENVAQNVALASVKMAPCVSSKDISGWVLEQTDTQIHDTGKVNNDAGIHAVSYHDNTEGNGRGGQIRTDGLLLPKQCVTGDGASVNHCAPNTYKYSESGGDSGCTKCCTPNGEMADLDAGNTGSAVWGIVDAATAWLWSCMGTDSTVPVCAVAVAL